MEQFTAKYKMMMNSEPIFKDYQKLLKTYIEEVNSVKSNLRGKISSYDQIGKKLSALSDNVLTCSNVMSVMGNKIYDIGKKYQNTEKNIVGSTGEELDLSLRIVDMEPYVTILGPNGQFSPELSKLIGAVGPAGEIISSIVSTSSDVTSNDTNWFDVLEDGIKIADKGIDIFDKYKELSKADWADYIVGLNVSDKAGKGFLEVFRDELSETVVDGSKTGVPKWLGTAAFVASAVGTAWDNFQDYQNGEMGVGRAILETGSEIAVDIVLGAGATALAAALLPVGAPAVAVGAIAVGVTWAAEWICESLTEESLTETVSDFILDTGQWIGESAKEAGNAICNWWSSIW
ncbi:MAG: hypothetical protein ACRDBO_11610 [Lachnospiraceae bacterium]